MLYKYETHLHTSESSSCGESSAEEMVLAHKNAGYSGIIVTDHFYNANRYGHGGGTWKKNVRFLHRGYEKAAAMGAKVGLDVFFGWEITLENMEDFLTFNLSIDFLLDHPEIKTLSLPAYSRLIRDAGGLLVQAHPFRQAYYIPPEREVRVSYIDGLEVNNGMGDDPAQNNPQAVAYADEHPSLFRTSGTDVHHARFAGASGMAFRQRFDSMQSLSDAMRRKEGMLIVDGRIEHA